jgi:glyoxylase-like metal-dependent hydrolase (beta-lactamase superfamily II)
MAIFVPPAVAQESISHTSARRGREIVGRAIDAMGGLAALQRLGNVLRELAGVRTDVGQGPRPVPYVRVTDRIGAIPPTINRPRVTSVRDMKQFRASEHVRDTIYGGQPLNFKTIVRRDSAFSVSYDYMYQSLRTFPQGAQQLIGAALFRRYPESLVLNAWRRPGALRHLGARQWEDRPHTVVGYADTDGAQLTLFFDDRTGLLSKVETLGEDGVLGDVTNEVVYEDYRDVAGIRFPFRYIDRVGGVVLQDLRATTLLADTQLSDTIFQHPDFEERKPALPFPTVTTLGDNVYAIMGDYNSIVAVMHDHVIVLEAGGSPRAASAIIAKIRELAPGKPIRYLIATHWNYDHLAGIRSYVAEGTTIVGLPSIKEAAEIAVASKRPLYPDTLAAAPRPLRFEPLGGTRRVFTDGSVMLEVHDISPSPHSDEMLIAYLPNQKILYTADVFDLNVPGHVGTAGHDTADLAAKIAKLGLEVERIVPVHGQIGTMADLQQALSRRGSARTRQP